MNDHFRVCFVSGKLGDVDGVSLEVDKWISVLQQQGHEVFTIAGKYTSPLEALPAERQMLVEKIRFDSEEQDRYETLAFPHLTRRPPHLNSSALNEMLDGLESEGKEVATVLHEHVVDRDIDVIIAENTNAMPMTLIGGMGMYRLATEKRMATIFHHHDFWWERSRFSHNHIESLLNRIMPPVDLGLEHAVISSYAAHILRSLKRVQPHIIPNCEDFDHPVNLDSYNGQFRSDLGFASDDILFVQPTRIVPRKRIEDSVELVGRFMKRFPDLADRVHYIVSLYQGDEPDADYIGEIRRRAEETGVRLHLISDRVASVRGDRDGKHLYTNRDVLANADFVTYLPIWEGFGNALLEAVAAKVPVVTTTYLVYKTDIMNTGIRNVEIRDAYDDDGRLVIPERALDEIHHLISHREERQELVTNNFDAASRRFGYATLSEKLRYLIEEYSDEIRASRKRMAKTRARYSV